MIHDFEGGLSYKVRGGGGVVAKSKFFIFN